MSNQTALVGKNTVSIQPRIEAALARASKATGVDFKYLVDTAVRESNLKTSAKSKSSSATGLFQFIDETWLSTLQEFGPKFGLQRYSDAIERTASGRHFVSSPARSREILALRTNPEISAMMAGAYAGKSAAYLKELLGRNPRQGEVYIAHFLGIKGGGELVAAASQKPDVSAAGMFPGAAKANPSIFYDNRGRARSVREVYSVLVSKHSGDRATTPAPRPQVVRIPGQPLKLNDGLIKNLGRPMPVENMLVANSQYARSNSRTRSISTRPSPMQSQSAKEYKPAQWPVRPVQGQRAQYPAAGPGSLGYENAQATATQTANNTGSLVTVGRRPFAAFSKVAAILKPQVEQTRGRMLSKPTVLPTRTEKSAQENRPVPAPAEPVKTKNPGQIFVSAGASFFTMRGRQ